MNNFFKLIAFLCIVFVANTINAQAARPATVTADGLIVLDASIADLAPEYVADISRFGLTTYQSALAYFKKYVDGTAGRGITFSFDLTAQKMYITIAAKQYLVPLAHAGAPTVRNFNDAFRAIHEGRI